MADFSVTGADDFLRLSKALKDVGDKEMRKALHKGLRDAVKPVIPEAEKSLAEHLPYLRRGKAVTQVVQVKTGRDPGITVGVRYGSKRASNAVLANREGRFRHPVFADGDKTRKEWHWVNQAVPDAEGWFDKTYQNAAPELRKGIERTLESVADEIVRKAR